MDDSIKTDLCAIICIEWSESVSGAHSNRFISEHIDRNSTDEHNFTKRIIPLMIQWLKHVISNSSLILDMVGRQKSSQSAPRGYSLSQEDPRMKVSKK